MRLSPLNSISNAGIVIWGAEILGKAVQKIQADCLTWATIAHFVNPRLQNTQAGNSSSAGLAYYVPD